MIGSDGISDKSLAVRLRQPVPLHLVCLWDEVLQPLIIVFHTERSSGRHVAVYDMDVGHAVHLRIHQQPLFPVQLVKSMRLHAQPCLDDAGPQVVVQVQYHVELLLLQGGHQLI